jgi:hypothetical protein
MLDGRTFLSVQSDRLNEYIAHWKYHSDYGIHISKFHGYYLENLDFLKECRGVKSLYIQDCPHDTQGINYLESLEWLSISRSRGTIDMSRFTKLRTYRGDFGPNICNLEKCLLLELIAIWHYSPPCMNLESFPTFPNLESLEITQSSIRTLQGINKLNRLRRLDLNYLKKLENVDHLAYLQASLKILRIEACRKVKDFSEIGFLHNLVELGINSCMQITDLGILNNLLKLEHFSFVDTKVLDGDLSSIFLLKQLKHVGFNDFRHYSHSLEEVKKHVLNKDQ